MTPPAELNWYWSNFAERAGRGFSSRQQLPPLHYHPLSKEERRTAVLAALDHLGNPGERVDTPRQELRWDACWRNNPELPPYFAQPSTLLRWDGDFIRPTSPGFLYSVFAALRDALALAEFRDCDTILEPGCGSGFNLRALAALMPGKRWYGLERSEEALERLQRDVAGGGPTPVPFNLLAPSSTALSREDLGRVGVLTSGALEQVGTEWPPFLAWALALRPKVVVHIEPLYELYHLRLGGPQTLELLAQLYHERRGYLRGYLPALWALERDRLITLKVQRVYFGSAHNEGFSWAVWRPCETDQ